MYQNFKKAKNDFNMQIFTADYQLISFMILFFKIFHAGFFRIVIYSLSTQKRNV